MISLLSCCCDCCNDFNAVEYSYKGFSTITSPVALANPSAVTSQYFTGYWHGTTRYETLEDFVIFNIFNVGYSGYQPNPQISISDFSVYVNEYDPEKTGDIKHNNPKFYCYTYSNLNGITCTQHTVTLDFEMRLVHA